MELTLDLNQFDKFLCNVVINQLNGYLWTKCSSVMPEQRQQFSVHHSRTSQNPFLSQQIVLYFAFVFCHMIYPFWINPSQFITWCSSGTPHKKRYESSCYRLRRLKRIFVTEAALWSADTLSSKLKITAKTAILRVEKNDLGNMQPLNILM